MDQLLVDSNTDLYSVTLQDMQMVCSAEQVADTTKNIVDHYLHKRNKHGSAKRH